MRKEKKVLWVKAVLIIALIVCCVGYVYGKDLGSAGMALMFLSITIGMHLSKFADDIDKINDTKRKERLLNELLKDEKQHL